MAADYIIDALTRYIVNDIYIYYKSGHKQLSITSFVV